MKMNMLQMVTFALVIVGGLNWGLVGAANVNLVNLLFGTIPMLEKVVYVLVGLSAIYTAYNVMNMK